MVIIYIYIDSFVVSVSELNSLVIPVTALEIVVEMSAVKSQLQEITEAGVKWKVM